MSSTRRVAFVTCRPLPDIQGDDRPVADLLAEDGIEVVGRAWDDDAVDWSCFDAVIPRSCWNYHERPQEFRRWIERLDDASVPVWNSTKMIRWNLHKSYLRDCEDRGIAIVPTEWARRGSEIDLEAILESRGWSEAVFKPAVSANATETHRVSASTVSELAPRFSRLLARADMMVQPYLDAVAREGEISVTLIEGEVSHAVAKTARPGDFRVQEEWGGTPRPYPLTVEIRGWATRVLEGLIERPLYARVDFVRLEGAPLLMELELIEPSLYLRFDDESARRFAAAIRRRLAAKH